MPKRLEPHPYVKNGLEGPKKQKGHAMSQAFAKGKTPKQRKKKAQAHKQQNIAQGFKKKNLDKSIFNPRHGMAFERTQIAQENAKEAQEKAQAPQERAQATQVTNCNTLIFHVYIMKVKCTMKVLLSSHRQSRKNNIGRLGKLRQLMKNIINLGKAQTPQEKTHESYEKP